MDPVEIILPQSAFYPHQGQERVGQARTQLGVFGHTHSSWGQGLPRGDSHSLEQQPKAGHLVDQCCAGKDRPFCTWPSPCLCQNPCQVPRCVLACLWCLSGALQQLPFVVFCSSCHSTKATTSKSCPAIWDLSGQGAHMLTHGSRRGSALSKNGVHSDRVSWVSLLGGMCLSASGTEAWPSSHSCLFPCACLLWFAPGLRTKHALLSNAYQVWFPARMQTWRGQKANEVANRMPP